MNYQLFFLFKFAFFNKIKTTILQNKAIFVGLLLYLFDFNSKNQLTMKKLLLLLLALLTFTAGRSQTQDLAALSKKN